jgi:3-isopropylmalate/(R)-2-methylmalate dehydratase small subunit
MIDIRTGRAFVFGDNIDTDILAPGYAMKLDPETLASHCLEALDPGFATSVRPGDVLVAGTNFGLGSSREQAAVSLKLLGISAVLARSFARIFYRNAINLGLPALVLPVSADIRSGDLLTVDAAEGKVVNVTRHVNYSTAPMPPHLIAMIESGGLIPHLRRRFAQEAWR